MSRASGSGESANSSGARCPKRWPGGEFRDPILSDVRFTVTEVRPAPDLRSARVYVVPLGGEREAEALDALQRAAGYLRGEVNRRVRLKFSPSLRFEIDRSFEHVQRIDRLLDSSGGSDE